MAVIMRLRRMGRRNRPFYRLVVADSRYPRDGRYVDQVGHYNPLGDPAEVVIDEEKVMKWLGNGVEMSDTVRSILKKEGILKRWKEAKTGGQKVSGPTADKDVEAEAGATGKKAAGKKTATKTEKDPKK